LFCQVITLGTIDNWNDLLSKLGRFSSPFSVITNNSLLDEFLSKGGISSRKLQEIFPDNSKQTFKINQVVREDLKKYWEFFNKLKLNDFEIFSGIEFLLYENMVFLEKIGSILREKKNIVFIFDDTFQHLSNSYYAIEILAKNNGYSIAPFQLNKVKSDYDIKMMKNNETIKTLWNLILLKTPGRSKVRLVEKTINFVDNKIKKSSYPNITNTAFFLRVSRDDALNSIQKLMNEMNETKISHFVFIFDLNSEKYLNNRKIKFQNFFGERLLLINSLQNSNEGKIFIKQIKEISNSSKLILLQTNHFLNYLINQIFSSVAIMIITKRIIDHIKLKSIVTSHNGSKDLPAVVSVAKSNNILTVSIPSFIIRARYLWFKSDKICIYGKQGEEVLKSLDCDEKRIFLTGNPRYDYIKTINPHKNKKFLEDKYNLNSSKKLIIIGMNRWHKEDDLWMSNLIKFCNKKDFEIVIKIHPIYKQNNLHEESENKINIIKENCKNLKFLFTYDIDPTILISASDLVITDYSNLGIEATILDKPMITVNFSGENLDYTTRYHEYGASIYLEDYNKLEDLVEKIFIDEKDIESLTKGRKEIADLYNSYNDGKATQRILKLLAPETE
jgi:hypothetical protein